MRCTACGVTNPETARFCGGCGAPLNTTCASCGTSLAGGVRFCTACGAAVPAADSESAEAPAERRRISVLFVDLENFSSLAEHLDPEEVRTVQSRYFEVARSIVASHGGTIEKFIGDAVMAVWGAPAAHEDDAERAVRAALAIVHAVPRLGGAASGGELSARAAVTTGEAAVTIGALGQGMVAGDFVNIAARLQGLAPHDGVLVDEATRELAPRAADYEPTGPLAIRGRATPLTAHRATAQPRLSGSTERGAHTGPFVGRDRELRELVELLEGVVRDRRSRLVSVTGIAGIGKSRLAWEFAAQVEAQPRTVAWHTGRAPAYGEGITFAAVAEMVRRRIRVAEEADAGVARRQLAAALEELVRDEGERRWMERRVAVLLERGRGEAFDRDELFAAWRHFFERVADRSPAVLVFEDLQWADPALLDFIEHLATWTRDHPILIVGLARPELLDRRASWGVGLGRFTALHLERLPEPAMRDLLLARSPGLPDRMVRTILERAGGVPLYAVEVVRILADRVEQPSPAGEHVVPRGVGERGGEAIDVPDSLHGLIAARIDALPAPERRLLLSAAVLGTRFRPEALAAVVRADADATVRERVGVLIRRELLAVDEELGSPGHGQLGFVQDLVREVAYRTLGRGERRALHLAAARYLESRADEGLSESLASHLVEAHSMAPDHPDSVRIARRAVAALRGAAQDAMRMHVPERAIEHLDRALRLVAMPEQRAIILDEAALAAGAAARLDVAERLLRDLITLHAEAKRPVEATRARARLASVMLTAQRNEAALAELESAVAALGDLAGDAAGVEVASQLARARLLVGDDAGGLQWADRALEAADRLGLNAVRTDVLVTRGTARFRLGDEPAGLADLRQAIEDAEAAGHLTTELRARNNLAWLVVADDPRVTLVTAREGFELATNMGIGDVAVQLAEVACSAALDTGDWKWALSTIGELGRGPMPEGNRINVLAIAATIGALTGDPKPVRALEAALPLQPDTDLQIVAGAMHAQAWAAFASGAFEEAARLSAEASRNAFGAERAQHLALRVRACLWSGDRGGAADGIAELAALGLAGRAAEASTATLQAGLSAVDGSPAAAGAYRLAAEAWRSIDLPIHLALCLLDAHHLAGGGAEPPEEAVAILRSLGADAILGLVGRISPAEAAPAPARSRRPSADTARRTGAARRPRPAPGRDGPPG